MLALCCAVFSWIGMLIPLRLRRWFAYRVRTTIYWLVEHCGPVRRLYQKMATEQDTGLKSTRQEQEQTAPDEPLPSGDKAAVCYSGGTDSTLAAVRLAEKFDKVYLLTFTTPNTHQEEEATRKLDKLQERFGPDKFEHVFIRADDVLRDVYYSHFWRDIRKWGLFKANICGACKTALTLAAAKFCVENNIHYLATGTNREFGVAEFFIGQMPATIPVFEQFLERYGIKSLAPVYNVERSDKVLHEMGLIDDWRGQKFGLLLEGMSSRNGLKKRGQIACDQDTLTTIYCLGYCIPMKGYDKFQQLSVDYTKTMLDEFGPKWVPEPPSSSTQ